MLQPTDAKDYGLNVTTCYRVSSAALKLVYKTNKFEVFINELCAWNHNF